MDAATTYAVSEAAQSGKGTVVAVAPLVSSLSKGLALGTAAILGILLGVVGVILLIVGALQRSRSQPTRRRRHRGLRPQSRAGEP